MIDWLQGDKFQEMADYRYAPTTRHKDDYCHLVNNLNFTKLKDGDIIYTHTFYAKQLFQILKYVGKKVYVITHNGDPDADFIPPDNVLCWYSQNVMIDHPRVKSIPLGVENNRWFPKLRKLEKMERRLGQPISHQKLAYLNSNIINNPQERQPIYDLFEKKTWVTSVRGKNGAGFDEYLENICNHKYVFCPRGSSNNCHRRWECLYMGTVPIVKRDVNNWFYNDMPILYVNKWEEVTEELLNDMWSTFKDSEWDKDKLTFEWWKNKILKDCGRE